MPIIIKTPTTITHEYYEYGKKHTHILHITDGHINNMTPTQTREYAQALQLAAEIATNQIQITTKPINP